MKNKIVRVLFVLVAIVALGFTGLKIYDHFTGTHRLKYMTFKERKYSEPPIPSSEFDEKDLDSVFHGEICLDYNNIWISEDNKKIVCFEYKSGNLYVYKNFDINTISTKFSETYANDVFSWNYDEKRNDNKLIGEIIHTDKDSLMYWVYDKSKSTLKDDKGLIFNKITLKKNE